jgi:hypothetical protein
MEKTPAIEIETFLRLTRTDGPLVYVRRSAVVGIEPSSSGASVTTGGRDYFVRESVEQIVALLETHAR